MKKRMLMVLCALLIGATCFTAGVLAAGNSLKEIKAYLNYGITILFEGKEQRMYDAAGNRVYPISYQGTTYVPVRAVGNIFGEKVEWDGANNAVLLGEQPAGSKTVALSSLTYFDCAKNSDGFHYSVKERAKDNTGAEYLDPLRLMWSCEEDYWETYLLPDDFETFSGRLFIAEETRDSATSCYVRIYGDDELLYESPKLTKGVLPVDFSVDVSGVSQLKVRVMGTWASLIGGSWLTVYLADGVLSN